MEIIELITTVTENWDEIATGVAAIIGGFAVAAKAIDKIADQVVRITPWSWDNRLLGTIRDIINTAAFR